MLRSITLPASIRFLITAHAKSSNVQCLFHRSLSTTASSENLTAEMAKSSPEVRKLGTTINNARMNNSQLSHLLTEHIPTLDQGLAYQVAAAIRSMREDCGERPIGRKIGFTNKNIWPEYNIDCSNWSYMYDSTVMHLAEDPDEQIPIDLSHLSNLEPRLEPEIILQLRSTPKASMSDDELLGCVSSISHGFEIVQSIFPGWKFRAADTTAAFALHGNLLVGQQVPVANFHPTELLRLLESFKVTLSHNDKVVDRGMGSNVLGSPIKALRHLCELLEKDAYNPSLVPGELVTTGTLTRAWPIEDSGEWRTEIDGLALPGMKAQFTGLDRSRRDL